MQKRHFQVLASLVLLDSDKPISACLIQPTIKKKSNTLFMPLETWLKGFKYHFSATLIA